MTGRLTILTVLTAALAATVACTRVPEVDERIAPDLRTADYPKLVPLHLALEDSPTPQVAGQEQQDKLLARQARLKRRAEALRNQGVDEATRRRLNDAVSE
jgi:hypothetical protein